MGAPRTFPNIDWLRMSRFGELRVMARPSSGSGSGSGSRPGSDASGPSPSDECSSAPAPSSLFTGACGLGGGVAASLAISALPRTVGTKSTERSAAPSTAICDGIRIHQV
jgi:hypothetical protein